MYSFKNIEERAVILARYVIDTKSTVRTTAKIFNVSKSTVHKDLSYRLIYINKSLANDVKYILENNKNERHIRGGFATKQKYESKKLIK